MKKLISFLLIASLSTMVGCTSKPIASTEKSPATDQSKNEEAKPADQKKAKIMKFALAAPKDHPMSKGAFKFGELVEKETGGAIKVEVYTDGTLGGDLQLANAVKAGTLEGASIATAPLASMSKRFNVFELPFLFKDEATAYKILDGPIGKEVLGDLNGIGIIGLGYWENGFRNMTNYKKEVKTVADLKGLKIRTQENPLHLDTWKALGAIPTPIAFTEVFTALEQKVIDGQENPYPNIRFTKFYEVQKYLTNTGHVYNSNATAISKKFWDGLTEDEKKALQKASDESTKYQRQVNKQDSEESLKFLKEHGMVVTDLTPEVRQEFVAKLQPVYDKYKAELDPVLVQKVLEAVKN